jgi:sensor histidine kinase regulating citrate/malate metabolism
MHSLSLILFAVVLIITIQTLPISGKSVKQTATTTTTTLAPTTKIIAIVKQPEKTPAVKPASKVSKKKTEKKRYESYVH